MIKSSPSIWHYVVSVKIDGEVTSIFVAFLENINITRCKPLVGKHEKVLIDCKMNGFKLLGQGLRTTP